MGIMYMSQQNYCSALKQHFPEFSKISFKRFSAFSVFCGSFPSKFLYLLSPFCSFRNFWLNEKRLLFPYFLFVFPFLGLKS